MFTPRCRVPPLLGVPLRSQRGVQPQTTPQGWQGPLHHAEIWDNPDVLWLLPLQSPGTFIHLCVAWGPKVSPHLQAVDSILPQQDKFYLRPKGSCRLWDLRALTEHGRLPHNRPTRAIQPGASPRWEKACEDAKLFCVNQKCDPWCREGSCGHTASPPSPVAASPPSLAGRCVGVQHADPSCLGWGALGDPCSLLSQDLQAWGSQRPCHHQAAPGLKHRPFLPWSPSLPCWWGGCLELFCN